MAEHKSVFDLQKRIDALVAEINEGLRLGPDINVNLACAPSGEAFQSFGPFGRYTDPATNKVTDEELFGHMTTALRRYKNQRLVQNGKTIYWREYPEFKIKNSVLNGETTVELYARMVISDKELVRA